uniref:Uncharacterized protein n=1 Tax=Rhodnius prolixus TaxID=13249 RepID=T1I9A1_RHOPR
MCAVKNVMCLWMVVFGYGKTRSYGEAAKHVDIHNDKTIGETGREAALSGDGCYGNSSTAI